MVSGRHLTYNAVQQGPRRQPPVQLTLDLVRTRWYEQIQNPKDNGARKLRGAQLEQAEMFFGGSTEISVHDGPEPEVIVDDLAVNERLDAVALQAWETAGDPQIYAW